MQTSSSGVHLIIVYHRKFWSVKRPREQHIQELLQPTHTPLHIFQISGLISMPFFFFPGISDIYVSDTYVNHSCWISCHSYVTRGWPIFISVEVLLLEYSSQEEIKITSLSWKCRFRKFHLIRVQLLKIAFWNINSPEDCTHIEIVCYYYPSSDGKTSS